MERFELPLINKNTNLNFNNSNELKTEIQPLMSNAVLERFTEVPNPSPVFRRLLADHLKNLPRCAPITPVCSQRQPQEKMLPTQSSSPFSLILNNGTDKELLEAIVGTELISNIDLTDSTDLTDGGIEGLAYTCNDLLSLNLTGCLGLTDSSLKALSSMRAEPLDDELDDTTGLVSLNLEGCSQFTEEAIYNLICSHPHLRQINLIGTAVSDRVVQQIATMGSNVQELHLSGKQVSEDALKELLTQCKPPVLSLLDCPNLSINTLLLLQGNDCKTVKMDVTGCTKLNEKGCVELVEALQSTLLMLIDHNGNNWADTPPNSPSSPVFFELNLDAITDETF